jgi:hypothetical protein
MHELITLVRGHLELLPRLNQGTVDRAPQPRLRSPKILHDHRSSDPLSTASNTARRRKPSGKAVGISLLPWHIGPNRPQLSDQGENPFMSDLRDRTARLGHELRRLGLVLQRQVPECISKHILSRSQDLLNILDAPLDLTSLMWTVAFKNETHPTLDLPASPEIGEVN